MGKVALIIIYNHQFNKNIDVLEQIYKDRFSDIYHLVPFYRGEKQNVIPVYESSHYFQGYIAQGFTSYFKEAYTHYFFVADDLLMNPIINETNYAEHFKLNSSSCFIPEFVTLHDLDEWWPRAGDAYRWNISTPGVEAKNQLPDYEEAMRRFQRFGFSIKPLHFFQIWKIPSSIYGWIRPFFGRSMFKHGFFTLRYLTSKLTKKTYPISYPLIGSYSDICVVSTDAIKQFCHYCGVFASTNLFVEVALPTALVLSAKEIITENDLKFEGKALWTKEDYRVLEKYENSFTRLFNEFPENYLYIHPIKLSKWSMEK
jgi:hypothetical protein